MHHVCLQMMSLLFNFMFLQLKFVFGDCYFFTENALNDLVFVTFLSQTNMCYTDLFNFYAPLAR